MKFLIFVKIRINSLYNGCKVFEFTQHYTSEQFLCSQFTLRKLLNGNSGQLRTPILTLGKTVKLQAIIRLCTRLQVIMLNYWRVNES